ncbi:MAG: endolytic transglycosylase MltG [Dehalococcoidia bacterium]|nr:endolytic transglycosylase MltG [Dehalococcoidia bacterium]
MGSFRDPRLLFALAAVTVVVAVALGLVRSGHATVEAMRLPPAPAEAQTAPALPFVVEPSTPPETIAAALRDAGVLTDAWRFQLLIGLTETGRDLRAGCYLFAPATPASEVLRRLRGGITASQLLAIPEGRRLEEVAAIIERAGIGTRAQWAAALASAPMASLPSPPPPGASLLGYLLPASYPVQCKVSTEQMVSAMIEAFTAQVSSKVIADARARGLSLHQLLTLASIVEREAVLKEEQPVIASVFLNRLRLGMPLQADPTVQFALAEANPPGPTGVWWKTALTDVDLRIASPYNTYRNPGLPPGPIANPGINAIIAVANAASTDYLYFVAKGDSSHVFSRTLDEHNANVARYQRR